MIVLAACSKSGDKKSGASTSGDKPSAGEGCQVTAGKTAELVSGKTAAPLAPFAGVKLGMSTADAAKACPNLFKEDKDKKKTGRFSVGDMVGKLGTASVYG